MDSRNNTNFIFDQLEQASAQTATPAPSPVNKRKRTHESAPYANIANEQSGQDQVDRRRKLQRTTALLDLTMPEAMITRNDSMPSLSPVFSSQE